MGEALGVVEVMGDLLAEPWEVQYEQVSYPPHFDNNSLFFDIDLGRVNLLCSAKK